MIMIAVDCPDVSMFLRTDMHINRFLQFSKLGSDSNGRFENGLWSKQIKEICPYKCFYFQSYLVVIVDWDNKYKVSIKRDEPNLPISYMKNNQIWHGT